MLFEWDGRWGRCIFSAGSTVRAFDGDLALGGTDGAGQGPSCVSYVLKARLGDVCRVNPLPLNLTKTSCRGG